MNDYTTTYRVYRELVGIKRAQWTFVGLIGLCALAFIGLGCYAGSVANEQINTISRSVASQQLNRASLDTMVSRAIEERRDIDTYFSLETRGGDATQLRVTVFNQNVLLSNEAVVCPASKTYADHLNHLAAPSKLNGVYMFAGGHGLGKSYAARDLGRILSRYCNAVVISVPMETFGHLNAVGQILNGIETRLSKIDNGGAALHTVWVFDELDSYLMRNRQEMAGKSVTQFAEYTGFLDAGTNRTLAFTMNNAELLKHDYWGQRDIIETNITGYAYANDFRKALSYTGLSTKQYLLEGQLSRLYSFIENKMYAFEKFNETQARTFAKRYFADRHIEYTDDSDREIFKNNNSNSTAYTVRTLKIRIDDVIGNDKNG